MKELQVEYTLEEIKSYIKDVSRWDLIGLSNTCRSDSGEQEELLTASFILSGGKGTYLESYCTTYVALTKDNYLLTTTILESTYGVSVGNTYLGKSTEGFHKVETLFSELPKPCRDELIAKEWLAKNPETLINKLKFVLEAPVAIIEDMEETVSRTEEMLINAHHNMKKSPKEMFTKSWVKWDVMKKLPWFKGCLEEELNKPK